MIADEFNEYMRGVQHPPEMRTPAMLRALKMTFMGGATVGAMATHEAKSPVRVLLEVAQYADTQIREEHSRN